MESEKYHLALTATALGEKWSGLAQMFYYGDYYNYRLKKPGDGGVESESYRESIAWGGEASVSYSFHLGRASNVATLGLNGSAEEFRWTNAAILTDPNALFAETATRSTGGVYGEYVLEPFDSLTLVAGVRYDAGLTSDSSIDPIGGDARADEGLVNPHFSFLWRATRGLSFQGAAARTFRYPRLRDKYDYAAGNPALKPETAWNYELGVNYAPTDRLVFKLSGYRNDVENLIYSPGKFIEFMNVGEARIWGFEAEVEGGIEMDTFARKLTLVGDYTYMDAFDLTNDRAMPYAPTHKVDAGDDGQFSARVQALAYLRLVVGEANRRRPDADARPIRHA